MSELNIDTKKHTTVICYNAQGQGDACHKYQIERALSLMPNGDSVLTKIDFQNGPIKEFGFIACHDEDLIAIVIDRLQHFQKGEFACYENNEALLKLEEALMWLRKRTMDRETRGVEGINIV